jgi:hypothetical protein
MGFFKGLKNLPESKEERQLIYKPNVNNQTDEIQPGYKT